MANANTSRYMTYAAGELLLVIVGILIALQINNWNEERIEQKEIREFAMNLSVAIERDLEMLAPVDLQIQASIRQAEELASYIRERSIAEMENAELFFLTTHIGYRPYSWSRAAIEQLKSAGGLRKMRNKELAQRISDYDALTLHLDQDYQEDEASARSLQNAISNLIDLNYSADGLEYYLQWNEDFTADDIERRLTRFRETDEYKRLADEKRPLISQNTAEFRRLANINRDLAKSTRARTEIELPRLRQFAIEIQAMIETEYR